MYSPICCPTSYCVEENKLTWPNTTTRVFSFPSKDLIQRDKWAIRAIFMIAPSNGSETSSKDRMALIQISPNHIVEATIKLSALDGVTCY